MEVSTSTSKPKKAKGKGRKKVKEAVKTKSLDLDDTPMVYIMPVQELLRQVEIIASAGQKNVRMPPSVKRVWGRAITAGKCCVAWFKRTDSSNSLANDSHQYFIDILEKAAADIVAEPAMKPSSSPSSKEETKDFEDPMR